MGSSKIAVYTGTRNYYEFMVPAVKSLLANSDVDKIYLLIEDDSFPYQLDKVETINVKDQKYFHRDGPNMNSRFTYMALMRAALAFVFPQYDRILSLDVDTIVQRNISELWEINLDGYYFAACPEWHRTTPWLTYTNAGVTMFNLEKLRDGKAEEMIRELNTNEHKYLDQDVMNELCQGKILSLDGDYNACDWTTHTLNPKIVHFAGCKDWTSFPEYREWL